MDRNMMTDAFQQVFSLLCVCVFVLPVYYRSEGCKAYFESTAVP